MALVKPVLLRGGFGFLEGPRWRDDTLWVSDIAARCVLQLDEAGQELASWPTPGRPSGLGWLPTGELLVVLMGERRVLRRVGDEWEVHADLARLTSAPLNDMVVSRAGNAYITGLGYDVETEQRRTTNIVLVRPDGTAEVQQPDLWRPNGCVITPDESTFFVVESRVHRVAACSISGDGTLRDSRVFATLPSGSWADGMCLDAAGGMWVADPKGNRCFYITADGNIAGTIDTGPTPCIACTLGGADGRTLFLLLSQLGEFDELAVRKQARIETVRADTPGAGSP